MNQVIYNALLVDNDMTGRTRLKTVALAVTAFKKAHTANDLREAMTRLGGFDPVDVVFVSAAFGLSNIGDFIKNAKETKHGADCAYVLVHGSNAESSDTIAKSLLTGANAMIGEPYSVDAVREIVEIATKVKKENGLARKKAAIGMLVQSLVTEYDKLVLYLSRGLPVERAKRKFAEKCDTLKKTVDEGDMSAYFEIASQVFESASPASTKMYEGGSKRVREKMEAKLREEFEKEFGKEEQAAK